MRMVAYVAVEGLYAGSVPPDGRPLVVTREGRVLDLDAGAMERGLTRGMALSEARSVVPDLRLVTWEPDLGREASAEFYDGLARHSDRVEPVDGHTAFVDLSGHPDPARQGREMAAGARVGVASCRWRARAAAAFGTDDLLELPPAALPISPEAIARIARMGYRSVGDLGAVSRASLRGWLGDEADLVYEGSRGRGEARVAASWPPASAGARFRFDGATADRLMLEGAIERLAGALGRRLRRDDREGPLLSAAIEREDGRVHRLACRFARPMASDRDVRAALLALLKHEPDEPISGLVVRVEEAERRAPRQIALGNRTDGGGLRETVAALGRTFGASGPVRADEMVVPRRVLVLREWGRVLGGV